MASRFASEVAVKQKVKVKEEEENELDTSLNDTELIEEDEEEEEEEETIADFGQNEQEEQRKDTVVIHRQVNHRRRRHRRPYRQRRSSRIVVRQTKFVGGTFILVLGHAQRNLEVTKLIEDMIFSGNVPGNNVKHEVKQEEEEAAKTMANEMLSTAGDVDKAGSGSIDSSGQEQQEQAEQVVKEARELLQTALRDFTSEDMPDTQTLLPAFDNAISSLFTVPVEKQSNEEMTLTFIRLAQFSLQVINFYKLCSQRTLSNYDVASFVVIVGSEMCRVTIKYGLYTRFQKSGGLSGLCTKICSYFSQLKCRATSAVSLPWPKTVTVFGIVIFATSAYAYYKFK